MRLGQLIVADVETLHTLFLKGAENFRYFLRTILAFELEREENLRALWVIVTIDELCRGAWMNYVVQLHEARWPITSIRCASRAIDSVPSRCFRDLYA